MGKSQGKRRKGRGNKQGRNLVALHVNMKCRRLSRRGFSPGWKKSCAPCGPVSPP